MKNNYFADERDFLKYDLWIELARCLGDRMSLTFIPMLTRDDGTKQGNKTNYECGKRNPGLFEFLRHCLDKNDRRIVHLRTFLQKHSKRRYHLYRDGCSRPDFFDPDHRESYFHKIPQEWLTDSIILIDPDNGLETKSFYWKKHPEKYVRYSEVAGIAARSSGNGAIIVVQFPVRDANLREAGLQFRAQCLRGKIGGWDVHWVAPKTANGKVGDVAFFVLAPNLGRRADTSGFLRRYADLHKMKMDGE